MVDDPMKNGDFVEKNEEMSKLLQALRRVIYEDEGEGEEESSVIELTRLVPAHMTGSQGDSIGRNTFVPEKQPSVPFSSLEEGPVSSEIGDTSEHVAKISLTESGGTISSVGTTNSSDGVVSKNSFRDSGNLERFQGSFAQNIVLKEKDIGSGISGGKRTWQDPSQGDERRKNTTKKELYPDDVSDADVFYRSKEQDFCIRSHPSEGKRISHERLDEGQEFHGRQDVQKRPEEGHSYGKEKEQMPAFGSIQSSYSQEYVAQSQRYRDPKHGKPSPSVVGDRIPNSQDCYSSKEWHHPKILDGAKADVGQFPKENKEFSGRPYGHKPKAGVYGDDVFLRTHVDHQILPGSMGGAEASSLSDRNGEKGFLDRGTLSEAVLAHTRQSLQELRDAFHKKNLAATESIYQDDLNHQDDLNPAKHFSQRNTQEKRVDDSLFLEALVIKALMPILKNWMEEHFSSLVEKILREEVKKVLETIQ
jgi:hypothetical protein